MGRGQRCPMLVSNKLLKQPFTALGVFCLHSPFMCVHVCTSEYMRLRGGTLQIPVLVTLQTQR